MGNVNDISHNNNNENNLDADEDTFSVPFQAFSIVVVRKREKVDDTDPSFIL